MKTYNGNRISHRARISPYCRLNRVYFIGNAEIGRNVSVDQGTYINSGLIMSGKIGKWCSLVYNVIIGPTEHDPNKYTTSPSKAIRDNLPSNFVDKEVDFPIIEDGVWIGANVVVLRGVRIGEGAIIGAGAVVNKDIPPFEIWGGVPAKFIKKRIIIK